MARRVGVSYTDCQLGQGAPTLLQQTALLLFYSAADLCCCFILPWYAHCALHSCSMWLCVPLIHVYLLQDAVLLLQCNAAVLLLYTAFIRPSLMWCLHIYVLFSKMLFFATQMTLLLLFFNSSDAFFVLLLAYFYFYVAFLYVYWLFWCDSLLYNAMSLMISSSLKLDAQFSAVQTCNVQAVQQTAGST